MGDAGAQAPHGEGGAHHHGVAAQGLDGLVALGHGAGDGRSGHLGAAALNNPLELLTVLTGPDGRGISADELDAIGVQDAVLDQAHGGVERRLPAKGGQEGVGALLGDDGLEDLGAHGLDVGGVGDVRVGHDRCRIGVDQDDPDALASQHAAGLRAGVVELARLADDDRPGADDQDGCDIGAKRHVSALPWSSGERRRRRGHDGPS